MSNIVRDSCDPGAIESYGVGKGHRVLYVHTTLIHTLRDQSLPHRLLKCTYTSAKLCMVSSQSIVFT